MQGLHVDYPNWIKKKKATINLKNTDYKCFQYVVTVALNYEQTKWKQERVSHIQPFVNKYNRKGINHPPKINKQKIKKIIRKSLRKKSQQLLLILCILKNKNMSSLYLKN